MPTRFRIGFLTALLVTLTAACGGAAESVQVPTSTRIPTYEYVPPTAPPSVATVAAAENTAEAQAGLDPVAVERGLGRYTALGCGECHDAAESELPPLSASTLTETEFIAFMRSGGELGPDHQFATNRLSDSGGRNLYQYLLSLRDPE